MAGWTPFWKPRAPKSDSAAAPSNTVPVPPDPWFGQRESTAEVIATVPAGLLRNQLPPVVYSASGQVSLQHLGKGIPSFPLAVRRERDVFVLPRELALTSSGELLRQTFSGKRIPNGALVKNVESVTFSPTDEIGELADKVDGPVVVVDTCWPLVYGHMLLEVTPMLMLLEHVPAGATILTSLPLTRTFLTFAAQLGVAASRLRQITGPLFCGECYFIDPPLNLRGATHPLADETFRRLRELASAAPPVRAERLFVSRSGIASERALDQNAAVEALFTQYGFMIFHPEQHSIEVQIAVFAGAQMVAGPVGSGLHNIVFSDPGVPMLVLKGANFPPFVDITLSPVPRRLGLVHGISAPGRIPFSAPWTIDLNDVEAGIRGHFGL